MSKKTLDQVEAMQEKAVRFVTNVLQDSDKAEEIESLTPEEYAERKRVEIIDNPNPRRRKNTMAPQTRAQLQERIDELEEEKAELAEENEELQDTLDKIADLSLPDEDDEDDEDDDEDADDEDDEEEIAASGFDFGNLNLL
jgi:hypothetical protein